MVGALLLGSIGAAHANAATVDSEWTRPEAPVFCGRVQAVLANTSPAIVPTATVFTDMPSYRHSKPSARPLRIYQVVTYAAGIPVVVSCKIKSAAHLRAAYGSQAAGAQRQCSFITQRLRETAVAELRVAGQVAAATRAASFVVDDLEPYITGRGYLADFEVIRKGTDGRVHLVAPGLFQDYDSWYTWMLPESLQGQHYCHLPTVNHIKAVAMGSMPAGLVFTTADDAPVRPR